MEMATSLLRVCVCVCFEKTEKINNDYIQLGSGIDKTTKNDVVAQPQKKVFRASLCFFWSNTNELNVSRNI